MSEKQRDLHLKFHGKILDQLGFQTYQSPVASLAELVSNSWDADAPKVDISLPSVLDEHAEISIADNGTGMTFAECEDKYLNVGWNRRGDKTECFSKKGRIILGRKGIGKFAGFGIAEKIYVETISEETGEKTTFEMNIRDLRGDEFVIEGGRIKATYLPPDETRKSEHGTTITLRSLKLAKAISPAQFARSMSRRFLLHNRAEGFLVLVNNSPIPTEEDHQKIEFVFPHDYGKQSLPEGLKIVDEQGKQIIAVTEDREQAFQEWGEEKLPNGFLIRWQIVFYEDTIDEAELQGISIFSNGKLSQRPFFFDLSGGLGGQHGQAYMSGQVQADFVDKLPIDPISAERQRINWENPETQPLLLWGQERIKELLNIWKEKRGEANRLELEQKVSGFGERLNKLPPHEAKTVRQVLLKLGGLSTLSKKQFQELGEAVLISWEQGRLHELIATIADVDKMDEGELLKVLIEADTLSALNIAEVAKTKLLTLSGLKERLDHKELELAVRDYIADNPWIISPIWETFKKELSMTKVIQEIAKKTLADDEVYQGRVDLILSSGSQLLVLEFMRPGLTIDWDHIQRFERYCIEISSYLKGNTACQYKTVTGYLIADNISKGPVLDKIESLKYYSMFAKDWNQTIGDAIAAWKDFLDILATRSNDPRLLDLAKNYPLK
ncbi:MAG: ATP-binding protein [Candidatus Bathyarchaeia archaeon]|jgi:hypothetical protein